MITAMGALGYDIYLLVDYGWTLNIYCDDIFYIWISEVICVFSELEKLSLRSVRQNLMIIMALHRINLNEKSTVSIKLFKSLQFYHENNFKCFSNLIFKINLLKRH